MGLYSELQQIFSKYLHVVYPMVYSPLPFSDTCPTCYTFVFILLQQAGFVHRDTPDYFHPSIIFQPSDMLHCFKCMEVFLRENDDVSPL